MSNRAKLLLLYKDLLKESQNFKSYYYRNYFLRKTQSKFDEISTANESEAGKMLATLETSLAILKRQTQISNMYSETKLVID